MRDPSLVELGMLERRLERLERHLGLAPLEPERAPALPPPLPDMPAPAPALAPKPAPIPALPIGPQVPLTPRRPPQARVEPLPYRAPAPPRPPGQSALEQTLGLKWAGWIGAVILIIGAIYGAAYAYDRGWLGHLPPAVRMMLMSAAGAALIAAGEWVYRRVNRLAATGLFGAGVAMLFVAAYAGHAFLGLYQQNAAFVLMGLATLAGAAVALRGGFVSIAVLSLIGGNLAPLLLGGERQAPGTFLTYIVLLEVAALFLAWRGATGKWWTLRGLALASTSLWMAALVGTAHADERALRSMLLMFAIVQAALFHGELILSALRRTDQLTPSPARANAGTIFSILVTAVFIALVLGLVNPSGPGVRGLWVIGTAGACAVIGFALREREWTAMAGLSVSFRIQAAALLVLAVPVALSGSWVAIGWGVLALAFAALGRSRDLDLSRIANVGTWALGAIYVLQATDAYGPTDLRQVAVTIAGTPLPMYLLLGWLLALLAQVAALLAHRQSPTPIGRDGVEVLVRLQTGFADLLWITVSILALPPIGATLAIVAYAWALAALDRLPARLYLLAHAWALLALAGAKWALADTAATRLDPAWLAAPPRPLLNAFMGSGCLIALSLGALYALSRRRLSQWMAAHARRTDASTPLLLMIGAVVLLLTFGLSVEIFVAVKQAAQTAGSLLWPVRQATQMSWTMLWMLAAVSYLAIVARVTTDEVPRGRRLAALGALPVLLAIKFLTLDTIGFALWARSAPAPFLVNLQAMTAAVVFLALLGATAICRRFDPAGLTLRLRAVARMSAVLVLLWIFSLEIDRWFDGAVAAGSMRSGDAAFAKQMALSICWGAFALVCILVGFVFRLTALRYFGLGLFALTLLKIVAVDLSHLGRGYRILSFMGVGLLLLGTSVLYGKFTPRLLSERRDVAAEFADRG